MNWLNAIESDFEDEDYPTRYDGQRMARVIRELAAIIEEEGLDYKWRKVLSDDAREIVEDTSVAPSDSPEE